MSWKSSAPAWTVSACLSLQVVWWLPQCGLSRACGTGRAILLGLEFLIAGDIIRTVVVAPTLQNVVVLGMIVLIRTFLSLSLQLEIEGKLPWRRQAAGVQD